MEPASPRFSLRPATLADLPSVTRLIAASARGLGPPDYTPAQIEAALGSTWGIDTELINDGTYFVREASGTLSERPLERSSGLAAGAKDRPCSAGTRKPGVSRHGSTPNATPPASAPSLCAPIGRGRALVVFS